MAIKKTSKKLSKPHRLIGHRIVYIRHCDEVSQAKLAAEIGLTTTQLANIESARTVLRFGPAWKICKFFNANPNWLLHGRTTIPLPDWEPEVMRWLEKLVEKNAVQSFQSAWPQIAWIFGPNDKSTLQRAIKLNQIPELSESADEKSLTDVYESVNLSPVNKIAPQMPSLLARIKKATEQKGAKSELAEAVGVKLASLSQWLSGEREPGGEYTLKLLQWVEQRERK